MTTQPEVIRQSDLINQLVLDRNTMEELGRVELLWMYPQAHRVLGFICKSGFLGGQKAAFQLGHIDAIGSNGVLTLARPEKTTAEKVRQLESLLDHEIWSDEGNRVGKIIDCLFQLRTGEITHYLFVSTGWSGIIGEIYQVSPAQILSFGSHRVLVSEAASHRFEVYRPGISQKLTQVGESLKEDAVQELSSIAKRAEVTTEQAKEQLQQLTEQARVRAQRFSKQFRAKAQVWNEQVKERTQTLLEQAKEKGQIWVEQVEEGIETLTDQAEDLFDQDRSHPSRPSHRSPQGDAEANPFDNWFDDSDQGQFDTDSSDNRPSDNRPSDNHLPDENRPHPTTDQPTPRRSAAASPASPASPAIKPDTHTDSHEDEDEDFWSMAAPPQASPPSAPEPTIRKEPVLSDDDDDEPWI